MSDKRLAKSQAILSAIKKGRASVSDLKDKCNDAIRKGVDLNGIAERQRIPVGGVHGRNYMKLVRDDVRDSMKETALAKHAGYGCWPFAKCDPPPPVKSSSSELMGCYKDTGDRDLPVRRGSGSSQYCAEQCKGYAFYGRQWTQECWCGASFGKHGEVLARIYI